MPRFRNRLIVVLATGLHEYFGIGYRKYFHPPGTQHLRGLGDNFQNVDKLRATCLT